MKNLLLSVIAILSTGSLSAQYVAQKPSQPYRMEQVKGCVKEGFWLKGHWEWDEARADYVWIKGHCEAYRKGQTYTPGRWVKTPDGWIWKKGFWKKI